MKKRRLRKTTNKKLRKKKTQRPQAAKQSNVSAGNSKFDFPQWICKEYSDLQSHLDPDSTGYLDDCRTQFQKLSRLLDKCPEEGEIFEIYTTCSTALEKYFSTNLGSLAHLCEYKIGYWHYRHVYKLKAYFDGLTKSMEDGNWLVAFTCLRNMLEEIANFDLFLKKITSKMRKFDKLFDDAKRRLRKSKKPTPQWIEDFVVCQIDIIEYAEKCIYGSDFKWNDFARRTAEEIGQNYQDLGINMSWLPRKTHVNDGIRGSQKYHNLPFKQHYDRLSELCHPNFGSNMMIIADQKKFHELFGNICFSHKSRNFDGACKFFQLAQDPIRATFSVGFENIISSQNLYNYFVDYAQKHPSTLSRCFKRTVIR